MAALEASGVGSIPAILTNNVPVAQLVEHSPEEPGVGGSIPSGYTITMPVWCNPGVSRWSEKPQVAVRVRGRAPYFFGDTLVDWLRQWTATPLRRVRFPYVSPKQYENSC